MMDFVPNELVYATVQQREREARAASRARNARATSWATLRERVAFALRALSSELLRGRRGCKLGPAGQS